MPVVYVVEGELCVRTHALPPRTLPLLSVVVYSNVDAFWSVVTLEESTPRSCSPIFQDGVSMNAVAIVAGLAIRILIVKINSVI